MTTVLFLLTGLLVGYVVYAFYSSTAGDVSEHTEPDPAPAPKPKAKAKPKPQAAKKVAEPEVPAAAPAPASEPEQYRNPESGDLAAVPTNYRFAKRWIKEALVTEGLLDKIYKNNEIGGAAETKVKKALDEFKKLAKYHG